MTRRMHRWIFLVLVLSTLFIGLLVFIPFFSTQNSDPEIDWLNHNPLTDDLEPSHSGPNATADVSYDVFSFYYSWYDRPGYADSYGSWVNWNHPRLPTWNSDGHYKYSTAAHLPPDDIASMYYPKLGPYSSKNPDIIRAHLRMFRFAGIGVLVLVWHPSNKINSLGEPADDLFKSFLNLAHEFGIKILLPNQSGSIRNQPHDIYAIGHLVSDLDCGAYRKIGFDGGFTHDAATYRSTSSDTFVWKSYALQCARSQLDLFATIAPGYNDVAIRPWNNMLTVQRSRGQAYVKSFRNALYIKPAGIVITSFNQWLEGSQIEPANLKQVGRFNYLDYYPFSSEYYLRITRSMIGHFAQLNQTPKLFEMTSSKELDWIWKICFEDV